MNQVGIDVSSNVFDATRDCDKQISRRRFTNAPSGFRQFITWTLRGGHAAQVCLEATGIYHLQLALALDRHPAIEVMVLNPCAARRFAQAHMVRAKTGAIDADGLLQYLQRKLLHALWGMLHHRQSWDGEKFYRINQSKIA